MTIILFGILFLPIFSALSITFFSQKHPSISAGISIAISCITFLLTCVLCAMTQSQTLPIEIVYTWLSVGNLSVDLGFLVDRLSLIMLFVVTGVGSLIHIYSKGYMGKDPSLSRYFASLSIFMFSMIGIVLANNFLMIFIFWEMVGLSSYLLIGFWMTKGSAADAAKKAFLCNRIGDTGFLLGIILVWSCLGTLRFGEISNLLSTNPAAFSSLATITGLLLLCGVIGKSAQFPLHVWLPDAMEGPTPVSALIHAATMVAAGVYLLARGFDIFALSAAWPQGLDWLKFSTLDVIATIGAFTALMAALIAVQQNDIKRILAYSTLSQLGYMVMAIGLSYPIAAMYHLTTHAFFKALLFLGAGSVIVALHHEQNIWKMGGLQKRMPITFWTFLIATLALCGIPPLSGFFSKDYIVAEALHKNAYLGTIALVTAFLTTFYMGRLFFVSFIGRTRSKVSDHAKENSTIITMPLILLAIASVFAGFIGIDSYLMPHYSSQSLANTNMVFPYPSIDQAPDNWFKMLIYPFKHAPMAAILSICAVIAGGFLSFIFYFNAKNDILSSKFKTVSLWLKNRLYFDELYQNSAVWLQDKLALICDFIDRWIIGGIIIGIIYRIVDLIGRFCRFSQTGNIQTYTAIFVLGIIVLSYWVINW